MALGWMIALGFLTVFGLLFFVPHLRRLAISSSLMKIMGRVLPALSTTERAALEAGTVWWEGDLFSGRPDWRKLLEMPVPKLSAEESAFLNVEVEELCALVDDWKTRQHGDLAPEVWDFLKTRRFFGLIIPKEHGGLGFSAIAHSVIITKLASRSVTAAVTAMVPNSLGPAELILNYGTLAQKSHYLPRLARGEEIPCFGLTEPEAGSDAASTLSHGVICNGTYEGKDILGIRLNWSKRYITLGPVATVLGLAFQLNDPEHLLGDEEHLGITCALVPTNLPGIEIGKRHDPLGVPFQNGPNSGKDVFIPIDFIIGGKMMAGNGWRMLMQSLVAGRSISLPALAVASMQLSTRVVSAYATVRKQFDTPIGRFEGVEEPLSRIGGLTYMMNATRVMTAGAIDLGEKPAVASAIAKAYLTETMRDVVCDAMDICAGAGICRGPRNLLEQMYMSVPIAITVEGANILTRTMIIFGQGAIRCHPFVQKEMTAVAAKDLKAFDRAFFGHLTFVLKNTLRSFGHALTASRFAGSAGEKDIDVHMRRISRMSSAFALLSDAAMGTLGGKLKQHEMLSGRFADALAWMYMSSAAMKRFVAEGRKAEHLSYVHWSCEHALFVTEKALLGVLRNFPNRFVGRLLSFVIFPFGPTFRRPKDHLSKEIAHGLAENSLIRDSLTSDIFVPDSSEIGLGRLEVAFEKAIATFPVDKKVRVALHKKLLDRAPEDALFDQALERGIISKEERERVRACGASREEVIQVDAFTPEEFAKNRKSLSPEPPRASQGEVNHDSFGYFDQKAGLRLDAHGRSIGIWSDLLPDDGHQPPT